MVKVGTHRLKHTMNTIPIAMHKKYHAPNQRCMKNPACKTACSKTLSLLLLLPLRLDPPLKASKSKSKR